MRAGSLATHDVLKWLQLSLQRHAAPGAVRGAQPQLLAACLPERERWVDLIRETLEQEDGVLVNATELGEGVHCGDIQAEAPELLAAVAELLNEYNDADSNAGLSINLVDDYLRVESNYPYGSVSAAQRAIREVASAVCSDDLRSTDLVALSYAEDALDAQHLAAVWRLLMQLPELLRMRREATLIVIAGDSAPRFDVHCSGPRSLSYRLSADGLHERRPWVHSITAVQELRRHNADAMPLFVLFIGAGSSASYDLPSGDRLRNEALAGLLQTSVDSGNWREAAEAWFGQLAVVGALNEVEIQRGVGPFVDGLTLERVLEVEQNLEGQKFTSTLRRFERQHKLVVDRLDSDRVAGELTDDGLVRLVYARARLVLVTVNFDRVIEARAGDSVQPFYTEAQLTEFPCYLHTYRESGGAVPLVKLHGDIGDPETIVANLQETSSGLSKARADALEGLVRAIRTQEQRPWWYVGYSMRDADLLSTWSSTPFADLVNERWVIPFLDPSVKRFIQLVRLPRWQRRGLQWTAEERVLYITADDFYKLLADKVTLHW